MNSLSIFFPCYNDEKSIGKLIETAVKTAKKLTEDYEVIVVNDGSTDHSAEVLAKYQNKYPQILKIVTHKKNRGYGGALKSGFKSATKDLIFYTDGDAQYDVEELPLLWMSMRGDVSFVNGIKMIRRDYAYRVIMGQAYAFFVRWMFLLPIYDVDCDFRLIKKNIVDRIKNKLTSDSGSICTELVKESQRAGASFAQVSVTHLPRMHGKSQFFRFDRLVKTALELSRLWWRMMILKS